MKQPEYHENLRRGIPDFPLEFYRVDSAHPRYQMACHWHDEFELIHVLEGELCVTLGGADYTLHPGDTVLVAGGIPHAAAPRQCVYACTVFDMAMLLRSGDACKAYLHRLMHGNVAPQSFFPADCEPVHTSVQRLFATAFRNDRPPNALVVFGALFDVFGWIFESGSFSETTVPLSPHNQRVRNLKQVLSYIELHYSESITLSKLAQVAGMSPKYFCRFFRQMTGRTPIDYVNYYRIEQACEALSANKKSVTEVALDCGFNDISYFIKLFRRHKEVSPGKYLSSFTA